jgi:hypothetical protein
LFEEGGTLGVYVERSLEARTEDRGETTESREVKVASATEEKCKGARIKEARPCPSAIRALCKVAIRNQGSGEQCSNRLA